MKKILISTTTHEDGTHKVTSTWSGDYIEAASTEAAIEQAARWEADRLREDGADNVAIDGDIVTYTQDGAAYYIRIHADTPEQ